MNVELKKLVEELKYTIDKIAEVKLKYERETDTLKKVDLISELYKLATRAYKLLGELTYTE